MAAPIASRRRGRGDAAPTRPGRTGAARCEAPGCLWPPGAGSGPRKDGRGGDPVPPFWGTFGMLRH